MKIKIKYLANLIAKKHILLAKIAEVKKEAIKKANYIKPEDSK